MIDEDQYQVQKQEVEFTYSMFVYAIRSRYTKESYFRRLRRFFDCISFCEGETMDKRCNEFAYKGRIDSNLVNPIRNFLQYAKELGHIVHILGQEKNGRFHDHLQLIGPDTPAGHLFIPGDQYIKEEIQQRPNTGAAYGKNTNFFIYIIFIDDYLLFLTINNFDYDISGPE